MWLDADMEFHKYPSKFLPGAWEPGPRDALLFNFWGNESKGQDSPSIGGGVAYFNYTLAARNLLVAWAESMVSPSPGAWFIRAIGALGIEALAHWGIGALGHSGIRALGHWGLGAFAHWGITLTLSLTRPMSSTPRLPTTVC